LGLGGVAGTPIKSHYGGSLNLVQTLLDFGRTHNLVRARREDVRAAESLMGADRNRVALEVQQAYLQALQARRLVEVNRQVLAQRELVAKQATTLMENGLVSRVDVDLAEVNVSQARLGLVRAQSDVETAFAALSTAMGRVVSPDTALSDLVPGEGEGPAEPLTPLQDALDLAERQRPELQRGASPVKALEHLASAAKAGKRPLVTGVASVGKINPVPLFEAGDKPYAVGAALTIPIFTGGLVEGQVREARSNAEAARQELAELTNVVRQQVTAARANLAAAEEAITVARAQAARAQDALSLATQRYQSQLGTIVELHPAQDAYAAALNDLVRAQYDRELARAALAYATGRRYQPAASGGK
jgi:outer membrane protein